MQCRYHCFISMYYDVVDIVIRFVLRFLSIRYMYRDNHVNLETPRHVGLNNLFVLNFF